MEETEKAIANILNRKGENSSVEYKDEEACIYGQKESFNEKLVQFLVEKYNAKNPEKSIKQCSFYKNRNLGTNKFWKLLANLPKKLSFTLFAPARHRHNSQS